MGSRYSSKAETAFHPYRQPDNLDFRDVLSLPTRCPSGRQTPRSALAEYTTHLVQVRLIFRFLRAVVLSYAIGYLHSAVQPLSLQVIAPSTGNTLLGALHASDITCASTLPSTFAATGGVSHFFRFSYDSISRVSRYSSRMLYTNCLLLPAYSAVRLYFTWSFFPVRSNISNTRAHVISRALWSPAFTIPFR